MRYSLLFVFLFLCSTVVWGQHISGRITDTAGKSIEYVNVGVAHTTTGVISDGDGNFSLHIPDSLSGHEIVFSHVSFDALRVPAADLIRRSAAGESIEIRLPERSVAVPEVVVFSGEAQYKRYGASSGSAIRRVTFTACPRIHAIAPDELPTEYLDSLTDLKFNGEVISPINIRKPILLREISIPVSRMPHDSLLVRLNLYRKEAGELVPIHQTAIYSRVENTVGKTYYHVDVLEDQVVMAPGTLYVGFEIVRYYGFKPGQEIVLPFHLGGGYMRKGVDTFAKIPGHPGIQVYGRILSE